MAPPSSPDQDQDGRRTPDGGGGGRPWWRTLLRSQLWLWVIALIAVNVVVSRWVGTGSSASTVQIAYSTFKDQVRANNVIDITNSGDTIDGHARKAVTSADGSSQGTDFTTTRPAFDDASLTPLLEAHGVTITAQSSGGTSLLFTLLFTFGPIALLVGFFVLMMRRAAAAGGGAGLGGLGRSRARLYDRERPGVTFADVAGADEAVAELGEVVDFLKEPDKYQRLGGAMPKGVLLVGPPGTGKTLLARAVAGEAQVPFFNVSASEFVEMIVGVGAARVRDLFAKARQAAPAIVFIDELDAVGRSRSAALRVGGHDEQEQTLNQILTEMDGFDSREGVVVLAATNRPDVLDSALLRPGRFDRNVTLEAPDRRGRAAILAIHTRHMPLAADVDIERVAAMTTGLVGADLKNLVNEAALLAARTGHDSVTADDLEQAFEKTLLGAERHLAMSLEERRRIAYHEAGHALVGLLVPDGDPVRKVSIVPRGRALGVTLQVPVDDRRNLTEEYLRGRITGALGGRAAESVVLGTVTTGAEDDLRQATGIAHEMVVRWGMSPRVGPLQYTEQLEGSSVLLRPHTYSEATARMIDAEVKRIVDECFETSLDLLRGHRLQLAALAEAVLAAETLDEAEIRAVVDGAGRGAAAVTGSPAGVIAISERPAAVAG